MSSGEIGTLQNDSQIQVTSTVHRYLPATLIRSYIDDGIYRETMMSRRHRNACIVICDNAICRSRQEKMGALCRVGRSTIHAAPRYSTQDDHGWSDALLFTCRCMSCSFGYACISPLKLPCNTCFHMERGPRELGMLRKLIVTAGGASRTRPGWFGGDATTRSSRQVAFFQHYHHITSRGFVHNEGGLQQTLCCDEG